MKSNLSDLISAVLTGKNFEREPSTRDRSVREMCLGPHHIYHKNGIKGGVSGAQLLGGSIAKNNVLFKRLVRGEREEGRGKWYGTSGPR